MLHWPILIALLATFAVVVLYIERVWLSGRQAARDPKVRVHALATHRGVATLTRGRLMLTEDRLVFEPFYGDPVDLELRWMCAVELRRSFASRPALMWCLDRWLVVTIDGPRPEFGFLMRHAAARRFAELLSAAPEPARVAPHSQVAPHS